MQLLKSFFYLFIFCWQTLFMTVHQLVSLFHPVGLDPDSMWLFALWPSQSDICGLHTGGADTHQRARAS